MDATSRERFAYGVGDRLVFPTVAFALLILVWVWPVKTFEWLTLEQAPLFAAGVVLAAHLRSPDVILWFPTFPVTRIMSGTLLLRSFATQMTILDVLQWTGLLEWRAHRVPNAYRAAD